MKGAGFTMKYEKIPYFRLIPIILISIVLFRLVNNIENIAGFIGRLLALISYFAWGFSIAYLLNPIMTYIERKTKMSRGFSLIVIYTTFLGIMALVVTLLMPVLVKNIFDLIGKMPDFITKAERWITEVTGENEFLLKHNVAIYIEDNLNAMVKNANSYFGMGLKIIVTHLINFSSVLLKFFTGIVISIYLLKDKEVFIVNIKKFIFITFGEKRTNTIVDFGNKVNIIFKQFVVGKFIDSIIVGILCFIALMCLKVPFAIIISIIIGITNMIPYFGNVIGMVPACIITVFYSPVKSIEVAIVILVLQQLDGWFIGPKILGDKVGLNPLWIILGIAIGGGLYGVVGMFLGVPAIAVVKTILEDFVEKRSRNFDTLDIDEKRG